MPVNTVQPWVFDWAFGQRKQSDILTAISASLLTKKLPYREFTPATMEKFISSDRAYYGKGHSRAARVDEVGQQFRFGRTFDATSESIAWGLSLLMGGVQTSGGPVYQHIITWQDPAVAKECLYTTIIEKGGAQYEKIISGVFFEQVSFTAEGRENLQIAITASGRRQVDTAQVLPAVTKSPTFRSNHATFTFGAVGAQTAISESVTRWTLTLNQNPDVRWMPGQTSGEEKFLRYALIGAQTIGGSITFFLSGTLRDMFLNHSRVGLTITCTGVYHADHEMKIEIPVMYINQEALAEAGQTAELTLSFNEDSVVQDDSVSGSPIKITLKNDIALLLQ